MWPDIGETSDGVLQMQLAPGHAAEDAAAVEAGHEPIRNPSAAQVADKLAQAKAEAADVVLADAEYDDALKAVSDGRARAEELVYKVMDQLRFHLRRETPASQRLAMRRYGAKFSYVPGEPVDPEDQPAEDASA